MELYHILNRGVEKRDIVHDEGDRMRFVHDLYALNSQHIAANPLTKGRRVRPVRPLVKIHAWCLMPNHYHMLVSPEDDEVTNISRFAQKIGMGYSKFFNEKYSRSGVLWQGVFKKIHIERDAHFNYIPFYIHLNPLDLSMPEWRSGTIRSASAALKKLEQYRWSSFLDYQGKKNFPSVIDQTFLGNILGNVKDQQRMIADLISNRDVLSRAESLEVI